MSYPILASSNTWYDQGGTTVKRSSIVTIDIKDSYSPTGTVTDSWDASAALDGSIMAYVEGTKLTIAGNGSSKIAMNEDSSYLFYKSGDSFVSCAVINGLDLFDSSNVKNLTAAFAFCKGLTELDLSSWDVSNVEAMSSMFYGNGSNPMALTTLDVSNWDVSEVTDMSYMFNYCSALTELDVSNWDTSSLTNVKAMFQMCEKLMSLDVSNWDVSNITDMGWAFYRVSYLKNMDVSNWDVSKVESFHHCFAYCGSLKLVGYENWDVSSVKTMNCMFGFNSTMTSYDLSKWDVSNVESFAQMFDGNGNLVEIKGLENWDTSNGKHFYEMFYGCRSLKELDLSSFDTRNANDNWIDPQRGYASPAMTKMFSCPIDNENYIDSGLYSLQKITLGPNFSFNGDGTCEPALFPEQSSEFTPNSNGHWYTEDGTAYAPTDIPNLTAATYYYIDPVWLREYVVKGEDIATITDLLREKINSTERLEFPQGIIDGINELSSEETTLARNVLRTRMASTNLNYLFEGCLQLIEAPMFDMSKATQIYGIFNECENLIKVPLYDTSNVTNFTYTFRKCKSLQNIPLLDTSKATDMRYMFYHASPLSIPHFNTQNVIYMQGMFDGCNSLTSIPLFNTVKVENMNSTFAYCIQISIIPEWDVRSVTNFSNIFIGCWALAGCYFRNIKTDLTLSDGSTWGHLLTRESLIHLIRELRNTGSSRTLTIKQVNLDKISNIYVRLIDITDEMRAEDDLIDEKLPFEICESTDEGAMLITDYVLEKNWQLK